MVDPILDLMKHAALEYGQLSIQSFVVVATNSFLDCFASARSRPQRKPFGEQRITDSSWLLTDFSYQIRWFFSRLSRQIDLPAQC